MLKSTARTVPEYIAKAPLPARRMMSRLRNIIHDVVPGVEEVIAWRMPMYKYKGMLVGYAAFEHHVGFYAIGEMQKKFGKELEGYHTGKGSVQFPIGAPLPVALIRAMVAERVVENDAKAEAKAAKKAAKKSAAKQPAKRPARKSAKG